MKRLALLIACLAACAAKTSLAAEPAACMAACTSEQRQCEGRAPAKQERLMAPAPSERSVAALHAKRGLTSGHDVTDHDNSTSSFKRMAKTSSCEAGFQQCSRDCGQAQVPGEAGTGDQAARKDG